MFPIRRLRSSRDMSHPHHKYFQINFLNETFPTYSIYAFKKDKHSTELGFSIFRTSIPLIKIHKILGFYSNSG